MIFHLVAVGRIAADLQPACENYANRIRRYTKFSLHEIPGSRSARDQDATLHAESKRILNAVQGIPNRILLTRVGTALTSRKLADRLQTWREGANDTAFIIGGAFGTHQDVADLASDRLSLSRMTLPHDLARLFFLEQLYRGFSIIQGEPYHKGE